MPAVFIVIEADPFIRQDLAEILALARPGTTILVGETSAQAMDLLSETAGADLVFLGDFADGPGRDDMVRRVVENGAQPVFLGARRSPTSNGTRFLILDTPFTNASVLQFVADWQSGAVDQGPGETAHHGRSDGLRNWLCGGLDRRPDKASGRGQGDRRRRAQGDCVTKA